MRSNSLLAVALVLTTLLLTACGGGDDSTTPPPPAPQTGTVTGTVISAMTGTAIAGATVRSGATTVISAADGSYTLTAGVSERAIISITAAGFAETFQVARLATGRIASLEVQLLPVGVTQSVTIAAGGTVTVPDSSAQVTFPPGGLIPVTGGTPAATVNVSLTPINPAIDSRVMPGDYTTVPTGSAAPVSIESFGALLVDIRDDSGTRYNLAAGQVSTVRIPLGTLSASPPRAIPLFYFNETTGFWVEEGSATLAGAAPNQYYEGTVTHFSFWNADRVMDTVFVTGCVRDAANQPVANVVVRSDGVDYSGSASTVTAVDGGFRVAVRRGGLATLSVPFNRNGDPLATATNIGPLTTDFTLPACLVTVPAPLAIRTWALPAITVGAAYTAGLVATSGTGPYSWSVTSGTLPPGMTLTSATGQISGTPTAGGAFPVEIQVQDSATPSQSASLSLRIFGFEIITQSLPAGIVGAAYNASLDAANGTRPYSWDVISGFLPTGLTLASATGQISGTPTAAGTFPVTVRAVDNSTLLQMARASFNITVSRLGITTQSLPAGMVGAAYNASLIATNGTGPYSWSVTSGTLPAGLTLASTGQISGTPTAAGTFAVTIQAQDSSTLLQSASASFNIIVALSAGSGTLTVANAPASVGGSFVARLTSSVVQGCCTAFLKWQETSITVATIVGGIESLDLRFVFDHPTPGQGRVGEVTFTAGDQSWWGCMDDSDAFSSCDGIMLNRTAGTVTFTNQELRAGDRGATPPIILNGTLNFPPF